ncbi:hypothetical protein D5086_004937 [Populus alba]|uniref:Uncharacterized protein n=1 Tax=Populus alba TaxID=43335 RepID=A0ACC4CRX2_POPAL
MVVEAIYGGAGSEGSWMDAWVKPAVVMIAGVDGGGKTTSLGKLAYRLKKAGAKILMAAGDTFRAATSDQLEIWAERTGCLHTNYSLMDELKAYKKAAGKIVRGAPDVVGITGFILTKLDGSARGGCVACSSFNETFMSQMM